MFPMRLGRCLKLPGSLTSWLLNEDNALNTLSWLRLCSYARRTDRSVSQKVGGRQRIGQQRLLGKSRCLQYVRHKRKRLCGRHIPYAVNAYRGEYMMRYSWAEITTASLLQFLWRYKKRTFSEQFFCCCTRGTIITISIFSCSGGNQYGENIQTHTFGQCPIYSAGDSGHLFHFAGSNCCSVGTFGV